LQHNKILNHLNLGFNQIGDIGAKEIGSALQKKNTLTHLSLTANQITNTGARNIERSLQYNNILICLNIIENYIEYELMNEIDLLIKRNIKIYSKKDKETFSENA
jgi:Leucine-rich repeat (LRR) protein